jgi:hypothetical protein
MAAIPFSLFKSSCEERGYTERVYEEQKNCVLFTNNGVKCEIKSKHYTFGWGLRKEDVVEMCKRFLEQGFNKKPRKDAEKCVTINFDGDILENFWIIVGIIESIETIVRKVRGQAIKPIPREVSERNIFEKIAKRFKYYLDNDDGFALDKWREQLEGDSIDHLITIGESVNRTKENTYREHIVPCVLIYNRIMTMLMEQRSVTEVAQMIKNNLAIVLITNEEAALLDRELDMQTSMPEGWEFGDSVFARLGVAQIKLK